MKIHGIILEYLNRTRQCGSTTMLNDILKNHDCLALVHRSDVRKRQFDECVSGKVVCSNELEQHKDKKPLLVDNGALWLLVNDYVELEKKYNVLLDELRSLTSED